MSASSPPDTTAPGKSCGAGTVDEGIPKELEGIFDIIEQSKGQMLAWLKDLVAIPSVSAEKEHRKDIMHVIKETNRILLEQDVHVTTVPLGDQQLPDGSTLPLPPLLLGATSQEPGKNTLCVYGHLDVYPAHKEDGWTADPFLPTEKDGRLFARGVAHDKGPLVAWIGALYAFRKSAAKASPVNLKFLVESMEEVGSLGLGPYLEASAKQDFFKGINFVCIPNGCWLSPHTPSISYGLRSEAMADLVHLLDSLMGTRGRIAVDGIHDDVAPISDSEWKLYEHVDFDPIYRSPLSVPPQPLSQDEYQMKHGIWHVTIDDTVQLLMRRWRYPSLTIHGIEGAHWSPGENAVIPSRVVGKFSVRTVPNQTCQKVRDCVTSHLEREFAKRNSPNSFKVTMTQGTETWFNETQRPHIRAAAAAVRHTYGVRPDLTREGGSVTAAGYLHEHVCPDLVVVSMTPTGRGFHSNDEYLRVEDLVAGAKLFAAYMFELSKLS
ncbi:cytosolic non-specific dipeptidase-like [Dermacentor variabilis]|uniref:cytosolic non-specific dipeptidase-like n=1 Tax=Dermacentor variabilis TaxID=34621 RepID=UPI003F5BF747